jgi:hypothetical protein
LELELTKWEALAIRFKRGFLNKSCELIGGTGNG